MADGFTPARQGARKPESGSSVASTGALMTDQADQAPLRRGGGFDPLHAFINNPPLVSYYVAAVGTLAGWSERVLHTAFLLPVLATLWGTWELARRFGANGGTAALLLLLAPGFFVSSTTLMADLPMLALWTTALACWDRGLREQHRGALLAGSAFGLICSTS